jgi:uncharacterized membrane protein HdeD (DUF308 family)
MHSNDNYFLESCTLAPNWWVFALRGALAVLFGGFALYMPGTAVIAMTLLFGAYALVDGVFNLISGINNIREKQQWGGLVFAGGLSIAVGIVALIMPQVATLGLTAFLWSMIAFWSLMIGVLEMTSAIRLRQEIEGEWLLGLSGILSVVLGIGVLALFVLNPVASVIALGLIIGAYALISGIIFSWLAFRLRHLNIQPRPFSVRERFTPFAA